MRHEKLEDLINLARRLAASAEGMTIDEMAREVGVSRRTAERMRDTLMRIYPTMEEIADPPTKRFRIPGGLEGFAQNPTAEELLELGKAAAHLKAADAGSRAAVLESLERKVRAAMRAQTLRKLAPDIEALAKAESVAVQAGPRPYEDVTLIGVLRHAIMAMQCLSFRYMGGSKPGAVRTVAPYGLMFSRMNYLVAAEEGSTQPRNWRLDRLEDVAILDAPGGPPSDFDLETYASRSFGIFQDEVQDVVLRISGEGVEDALRWRFHPTQIVTPEPDGSVLVRFQASGMRELSWHLFTWGDNVEVLRPAILRETLVRNLETALTRHHYTTGFGVPAV